MLKNIWMGVRFAAAWILTLGISALACLVGWISPIKMWLWLCKPWSRITLRVVGVKLHLEGRHHLKGPAVFICNHQSLIDVVVMPSILPRKVRFMAKRELGDIPLWGWALAKGGAILVDRYRPHTAFVNMQQGLKQLPAGWSLVIFPEGTRSTTGKLRPFKKGAFHLAIAAHLPMVPVGIDGSEHIVRPGGWLARGGDVWVTVGKPIDTSGWGYATLSDHVREGQAAVQACVERSRARRLADAPASKRPSAGGNKIGHLARTVQGWWPLSKRAGHHRPAG